MSGLSAEGFRALLDGGVEGVHVIDARDGRLIEVNAVSCARLGYSRAELLGLTVFDIVAAGTPVDPVQWDARVDQIRRQEGGLRSRGLLRCKGGATLAIEVSLACRAHGGREYVVAVWRPAEPGQSHALRQQVFRRVRHAQMNRPRHAQ